MRSVFPMEKILFPLADEMHIGGREGDTSGKFFISDSRYEESEHPLSKQVGWIAAAAARFMVEVIFSDS